MIQGNEDGLDIPDFLKRKPGDTKPIKPKNPEGRGVPPGEMSSDIEGDLLYANWYASKK